MRLLVVEDERDIAKVLKAGLEAESFTVDLAHDGERGSYLGRTNTYDGIILDDMLPGKNGSQVCREIRASGRAVPILMLTVQSDLEYKLQAFEGGADDYVTKPFSFKELLARIRAVLRRPPEFKKDILQADDLTLDTAAHRVERAGRTLYLTRKEFELLEYLLRNQGRLLTRNAILEHVWDMQVDPFSNTIETHIFTLRRKIDRNHRRKLIHTVPNCGYKLDTAP